MSVDTGIGAETLELTGEQRAALEAPGSVVVRAGAGSGKTAVLAQRYVRLVCADALDPQASAAAGAAAPLRVDQVLAVTFTDKAATQMRTRIRELVGRALARAAAGPARERLLRVRRELAGARISTIHGLAVSLLRAYPLESAVDPSAAVLEEFESAAYVEREVRRALLDALRAGDADVRRLAAEWGLEGRAPGFGLVEIVAEALATLARRGTSTADLERALPAHEAEARRALADAAADAARLVEIGDAWVAGPRRERVAAGVAAFVETWPAGRAKLLALFAAPDLAAVLALAGLCKSVPRAWRQSAAGSAWRERLDLRLEGERPRLAGTIPAAVAVAAALPLARALARVAGRVDAALAAAKRRDRVLTFDDLIAGARALLACQPALAAVTEGVRAILVDEFQDTDPGQADLLERLAGAGAELFVVGDEKQSIYRFRGADVALFTAVRRRLGRERPLVTNFRSLPPLLAFVNGLAARTLAPPAVAETGPWWVAWTPDQRLRPHRPAPAPGAAPVRLKSLADATGDGREALAAAAVRALEARVVAATIIDLQREGWRWRDVAVLMPALTQVKAYEHALRRYGVPYQVVRGHGFFACQEIRDLVHLLAAVADPDDGVALVGALRSPLFAVGDDVLLGLVDGGGRLSARFDAGESFADQPTEAQPILRAARDLLATLRAVRARESLAGLLERALEATRLEAVLLGQPHGAQKVANVRKLVDRARRAERRGWVTLEAFVGELRRLLEREPREPEAPIPGGGEDAVAVMSIHQAKGLEFPVVIVPDLGREPTRDYRSPVVVDSGYGVLVAPSFGSGRHRVPHRLITRWRERDRDQEAAERARLLYVACTRARDVLVLVEGRGDRRVLAPAANAAAASARRAGAPAGDGEEGDGQTPARAATWCHQVWSYLGRDAMASFLAGDAGRATLIAPGEGPDGAAVPVAVEVEKSRTLLARVPAPITDPVETALAATLTATPGDAERAHAARVFGYRRAAPADVVVTPTALADFAGCPRRFLNRHLLGLPETADVLHGAGTGAARLGIAAHAALERVRLTAPAEWEHDLRVALSAARELDPAEREELARDLLGTLRRQAEADGDLVVLGREVPFCLALGGTPTLFARGRIDLVAARRERLLVRDYKYAEPGDDPGEAYRVQMEVYALALRAAYPGRAVDAEVVYLRGGGRRVPLTLDLEPAAERLRILGGELARAHAQADEAAFPQAYTTPAPCRACSCPFVRRCFANGA